MDHSRIIIDSFCRRISIHGHNFNTDLSQSSPNEQMNRKSKIFSSYRPRVLQFKFEIVQKYFGRLFASQSINRYSFGYLKMPTSNPTLRITINSNLISNAFHWHTVQYSVKRLAWPSLLAQPYKSRTFISSLIVYSHK